MSKLIFFGFFTGVITSAAGISIIETPAKAIFTLAALIVLHVLTLERRP